MRFDKKAALAALLPLMTAVISSAQEKGSLNDTLSLQEAVVTTLKIERPVDKTPAEINIVTSLDVKNHSSITVADVIKYEPGLSVGGDGVWARNINVRGLAENRLVTLIDGNRIETATDLTASLSMVDVNDIERVEIIKGAQSSIYGSGAMGGIINIITKDGFFSGAPYFHGSATANYSTVNNGHGEYLSLNAGGRRWYVKANGSFGHADDIMTPEGLLPNSGFTSTNIGARTGFKPAGNQTLRFQFQRNWSKDVGIPGGASFSPAATATYKNIGRTFFNGKYEITDITEMFKILKVTAFYQDIVRDVEMLPNAPQPQSGAQPTRVTPYATHTTYGGGAQGTWKFSDNNTFVAGAEAWRRDITSERKKYINQYAAGALKAQMIRTETPLPTASYTSTGIFAQDEAVALDGRLILTFGGRFDVNFVENQECHNVESVENLTAGATNLNPDGKYVTFAAGSRTDASWSGNFGAIYKLTSSLDAVFNASRSYRSPALEELFKFIDLSGNKVHFGNPDLKAENGLSADLGARWHGDKLQFEVSGFVNRINDMIVERMTNVDPQSVNDTLMLDNASRALLYGAEFSASYSFSRKFGMYASGSMTKGLETSNDNAWLPLIPPVNGRVGLVYDNPSLFGADLSFAAAGARKAGFVAEGETPTEAYWRLDLAAHSKIFSFGRCALQLFAGVENITDNAYTNFLSTNRGNIRLEPGRNIYFRANFTF
ncbi:MAG: TonB-dependent receptor [Bacteroidales bacterium]|nr:TonB-dependent receptor [Bacteroidales bacterium]